jgi:hypothetical protein
MAFHENAGPRQVDFDLPFLKSSLSFMAEGVQSGPEQSRARSLRRQRTLDGEDRSVTIPPGRKGSGRFGIFGLACVLPPRPNQPCRHPSTRTLDERFLVSLGASWVFSFQPVLPPVCRPLFHLAMKVGPGHRRSHRNSALGRGASNSTNLNYAAAGSRIARLLRSGS